MKAQKAQVQELTDRLTTATDEERNVSNLACALDVVTELESISMTKTILEETRIGLLVNDIRKKNSATHPDFSNRCRVLIKAWQTVAKPPKGSQPNSNSNSRSGTPVTPYGISPAVRNRLTPNSSAKRPVSPLVSSSGGVKSRPVTPASSIRSTNTTPSPNALQRPANGATPTPVLGGDSYAPRPPGGSEEKQDSDRNQYSVTKSGSSDSNNSSNGGLKLKIKGSFVNYVRF